MPDLTLEQVKEAGRFAWHPMAIYTPETGAIRARGDDGVLFSVGGEYQPGEREKTGELAWWHHPVLSCAPWAA